MFLDCNSQKSRPGQLIVKVSRSCSPRTPGLPKVGNHCYSLPGHSAQFVDWMYKIKALHLWIDYESTTPVVSNLGPPDVLGLQLPEAFTSAGQNFWELKSKNIWRAKVGHHWTTQLSCYGPDVVFFNYILSCIITCNI